MPFAPILRVDRFGEVFDTDELASNVTDCLPYMTMCLPVRPWVAAVAPAVVHVDGTARPQVVAQDQDPFLYQLLAAYEAGSGIPVLINTSFNIHDEPLVSSAKDALAAFLAAELDVLCLEGRIITLADNQRLVELARLIRRDDGGIRKARHAALSRSFGRQLVTGPDRFTELLDTSAWITAEQ